ncbi:MAG: hypothetical protein IPO83_09440 [Chitinophagaceae bacterium]|nr:hypothetical protein [Chitinophagaceae bacterium]
MKCCENVSLLSSMKPVVRNIIADFLLLAFLFAITPKEFVHAVAGHHDTEECIPGGDLTIGKSHVHCQVLQLQVNPFQENPEAALPQRLVSATIKVFPSPKASSFIPTVIITLRGPPSMA